MYISIFKVGIALVAALAVPSAACAVGLSGHGRGSGSWDELRQTDGNAATTVTISTCTPKEATYASASGKSTSLLNGGTITCSTSKKTTVIAKPTVMRA